MSEIRLPRPEPRAEFRKRLRAQLMNEAVALAEQRRSRRGWSFSLLAHRLRPLAVGAVLVAVLAGGAGVAAAGSLPGDVAFPLKRAAEQVELALARGDEARVEVLAAQAQRRLDELQRASADRPERAPTASEQYAAAVTRFRAAVDALRAAEPQDKRKKVEQVIETAHEKHVQVLEQLKDRVPQPAKKEIERALEEQEKIGSGKPSDAPGKPRQDGKRQESERHGKGGGRGASPDRSPERSPEPSPSR